MMAWLASTLFSTATPLSRWALLSGADTNVLLVGRMTLATALLGVTIAVTKPELFKADRRCFWVATIGGLVNALGMFCYFWALERLQASMASMIITLGPLIVLTLLVLRGEKVTYRHGVRLALALVGVYLLIGPSGDVDLVGVAWVLVAVGQFACQLVLIQWYLTDYDARTVTFYMLLAMTVATVGWWLLDGGEWRNPGMAGWITIVSLAVFGTYASRLLLFGAVARIGGGQMSMLSPVETLLTVVWSILFLHERFTPIQWVGGALILTSAALAIQRLGRARWRPRWRLWARS
jgi:drug/metabolite transporter (DMT)-like permease